MQSSQEIIADVERLHAELKRMWENARESNLYGVERTLLHMISHVQTLLESLKQAEPGFSV